MDSRELQRDFEMRYGYQPLLVESFANTNHFEGTCYRAANWLWIGLTKGRGRQDRFIKKPETVEAIYVYPLEKDFRVQMGLPEDSGLDKLDIAACIDAEISCRLQWEHPQFLTKTNFICIYGYF